MPREMQDLKVFFIDLFYLVNLELIDSDKTKSTVLWKRRVAERSISRSSLGNCLFAK